MKIVVNSGRTVHTVAKAAVKQSDGKFSRPVCKANPPGHAVEVTDDEAAFLISRGFASKFEVPKPPESGDGGKKDK